MVLDVTSEQVTPDIPMRGGVAIVDPDSHEELGSVEIPKVLVRVARVKRHVAIARTFRTTRSPCPGPAGSSPRLCLVPISYLDLPGPAEPEDMQGVGSYPGDHVDGRRVGPTRRDMRVLAGCSRSSSRHSATNSDPRRRIEGRAPLHLAADRAMLPPRRWTSEGDRPSGGKATSNA